MSWLEDSYFYRRKLSLESPIEVSTGHIATVSIPHALLDNSKLRSDFEDLEVVHSSSDDATPTNSVLSRDITELTDSIQVDFELFETLEKETLVEGYYYIYYGNPDLVSQVLRPTDDIEAWPVSIPYSSPKITYTRPGDHWVDGETNTALARAALQFHGTQVRILSDVGFDKAIMEVQIDNGTWEKIDLFSSTPEDSKVVFTKTDLDSTIEHEIRIRASGEVNPTALGDKVNIKAIEYRKPVDVVDLGEEFNDGIVWSANVSGF